MFSILHIMIHVFVVAGSGGGEAEHTKLILIDGIRL